MYERIGRGTGAHTVKGECAHTVADAVEEGSTYDPMP